MFMRTLLKEYIGLIIENILTEDIEISKLSDGMIGVYAFAQAINKLITEGSALPGTVPIDIIDAGSKLHKASLTTRGERSRGISFQYSGNSFKLYLNPSKSETFLDPGSEGHDLVHAFTGYIAKAFGRRRQSIEKSGQYGVTPSRFNKIVIDKENKKKF